MQRISVETTQNVRIDYVLAGIGDRVLAFLLDGLVVVAYIIIVGLILSQLPFDPSATLLIPLGLPIFLYHLLCEALLDGQSLGKMQMHIKVIKVDGSLPSFGAYLLRWLLRPVDIGFFSGGIAVLSIAITTKGQRLGDLAAGTTVVKTKSQPTTSVFSVEEDYEPVFSEAVQLTDADIDTLLLVIKTYRESGNTTPVRLAADKIKSLLNIQSSLSPLQFLYTIVRDYKVMTSR